MKEALESVISRLRFCKSGVEFRKYGDKWYLDLPEGFVTYAASLIDESKRNEFLTLCRNVILVYGHERITFSEGADIKHVTDEFIDAINEQLLESERMSYKGLNGMCTIADIFQEYLIEVIEDENEN